MKIFDEVKFFRAADKSKNKIDSEPRDSHCFNYEESGVMG
jgi:hypothetical protein